MIIGITGKSGSGKTTIANILEEEYKGIVIHVDEIAHQVLTFGAYKYFLNSIGVQVVEDYIDRKLLGKYLFNNNDLMKKYNEYIYELIKLELEKIMDDKTKMYIIDWNFLPITLLFHECDVKILMKCDDEVRRARVKLRDNINDEYFNARESKGLEYFDDEYDIVLINTNLIEKKDSIRKIIGEKIWK